MLSDSSRLLLLRQAHEAVESWPDPPPPIPEGELTDELRQPGGMFVTWTERGELRGCIGRVEADGPLHETVAQLAPAAAFSDPRFRPVQPEEFPLLRAEISVLTPPEPIGGPEDIEIGRDGLIVSLGRRSGLLLPQVASERGFTPQQFLAATCYKAGVPLDSWREGARVLRFSAEVFADPEAPDA